MCMTMASSSARSTCSLLDLPDELLLRCMPQTGWELRGTRGACRRLLQLQLAGIASRSLRLCVNGGDAEDESPARKTLVQIVQSFPALKKLEVENRCSAGKGVHADALKTLLAPHPSLGPTWLVNVVDVYISDGIQLDNFIPQCLASACPQLKRLALAQTHCKHQTLQEQQHWQPVSLPHLQTLELEDCTIDMDLEAVQQQLQALPGLQEFKLFTQNPVANDKFSSKVTEADWGVCHTAHGFKGLWPRLKKVEAIALIVDDDTVKGITATMPNLRKLVVRDLNLKAPISKPPSKLGDIVVDGGLIFWGSLQSLRNLLCNYEHPPTLHYWSSIGAEVDLSWCGGSAEQAGEDLEEASSVASQIQRAGGLKVDVDDCANILPLAKFSINRERPPHVQQVLYCLLPIFDNLHCLILQGNIHVGTMLLGAVSQLPNLVELWLQDHGDYVDEMEDVQCKFEEAMWFGDMIAALSPQVTLVALSCREATQAHVTCLCITAPRPIRVRVKPIGWEDWRVVQLVQDFAQRSLVALELA